jgi:hypothetical protein
MSETGPSDINYTWRVSSMDCYPTFDAWQDVVFTVHWRLLATKEYQGKIYTSERYGGAPVDTDSISSFVPYDQLTLDQVIGWIYPVIHGDELKVKCAEEINSQINPAFVSLPPPWSN